ncbi:MAG: ABC transporter substrate-binding protein [Nitrososphaerales archaeon]
MMKTPQRRRAFPYVRSAPVRGRTGALILFALTLLATVALGLSACSGPPAPTPQAVQPSTPTRAPQPTSIPTAENAAESGPIILTWWTPEFLSPQASQPAGALLADQLKAFSEAQGGRVRVETVRKARYGKGGLLDSLRTAQPVASSTLPDIVALDAVEVEKAVEAGLLQPLDGLLDTKVTEVLYPFATEAGLFSGRLYAVQYLADIDHAAYHPTQVADPPVDWKGLIDRRIAYLFAMAQPQTGSPQGAGARPGEGLSHAVLSQYLSAGATLAQDRRLILESQPLLRLLTFYAEAGKAGVLPPVGPGIADGEAVWSIFSQGQAPLADVSARRFMKDGAGAGRYAVAPGFEGPAPSLASGWALAIVTTDPARQRAAAELITWLLKSDNAGAWAAQAGWLPTSSGALKALGDGDYWSFLDSQLAQARGVPAGRDYATTASRVQVAIEAVLKGQTDPAAAAEAAINGQ